MKLEEAQRLAGIADDVKRLRFFMSAVEKRWGSFTEKELQEFSVQLTLSLMEPSPMTRLKWRHVEMLLDIMSKELEQECAAAGVER